jgi:hypothetical protein
VGWLSGCFCEGEGGGCGSECGCWKDGGGGRSCRWRERREASAKPIELRLTAKHSKGNRRRAQPHKAHMPQPHIFHQEFCGLARHTSFMRLFRHTSFRHTFARLASSSALSVTHHRKRSKCASSNHKTLPAQPQTTASIITLKPSSRNTSQLRQKKDTLYPQAPIVLV